MTKNRFIIALVVMIGVSLSSLLFSCEKTQQKSACECYEEGETLETLTNQNGMPYQEWVQDYQTPTTQDDCNTAHDWIYNNQASVRWRKVCN